MPPPPRGRFRVVSLVLALAALVSGATTAIAGDSTRTQLATTTPAGGSSVSGAIEWRIGFSGPVPKTVTFLVDGTAVARDRSAPFAIRLDTTRLANGPHRLVARAELQRRTRGAAPETEVGVTVDNRPTLVAPSLLTSPTVTGSASVGGVLSAAAGTWTGSTPLTYTFGWERCDGSGGGCTAVTGATGSTFFVDQATLGRTVRARVTAGNAAGTSTAVSAATAVVSGGGCGRVYAPDSPWNTPIGSAAEVLSSSLTGVLGEDTLSSEPLQYAYPVYEVDSVTPETTVRIEGVFSNVTEGGSVLRRTTGGTTVRLRLPPAATPSEGSDAHLVVLDPSTGDEWGFWQASKDASGTWSATNGYHYNTRWSGVPPSGFGSRGAGVPYLAGLIRPCEIAGGRIDHALAFGYDYPRNTFVYPATKSDGKSSGEPALPEGARLRLDPTLTDETITSWGCTGACLVIAHAMQTYGMYVVDNAGRDKIYPEDDRTAHWNGTLTRNTISPIPERHLHWVAGPSR